VLHKIVTIGDRRHSEGGESEVAFRKEGPRSDFVSHHKMASENSLEVNESASKVFISGIN
jgi:hypothetical protein